ncbi:hypothetical protein BC829DRAFT_399650 [Chytridium lagenaria]|nr:hypothetical protein BC829DRAFT_399650 [Chytridium lagenaria]
MCFSGGVVKGMGGWEGVMIHGLDDWALWGVVSGLFYAALWRLVGGRMDDLCSSYAALWRVVGVMMYHPYLSLCCFMTSHWGGGWMMLNSALLGDDG